MEQQAMTDKHTIAARQNRLAAIMERIAASYDEVTPKIHHLDRMPLPSRSDAAAIMQALEEIFFPGYSSTGGVPDLKGTWSNELNSTMEITTVSGGKFSGW